MRQIKKEDVLVPLLERYFQNDVAFYDHFENLIKRGGDLYLSELFGISIIITNIVEDNSAKDILYCIRNSKESFNQTICGKDELDLRMFEEKKEFSFKRSVFKCNRIFDLDINSNKISLSMFINIAETNLPYHMISFVFTTFTNSNNHHNDKYGYTQLSNKSIINLMKSDTSSEFKMLKDFIDHIDKNISKFLLINKNTFTGIEFWRDDWKDDEDNILDAAKYIYDNPHYFYSILTMDVDIFRRNFDNIMNKLGWCFSSSRVQRSLFSRNTYLAITLKPRKEIINCIGHDGSEFKAWEILALQNYLLNKLDISYGNYISNNNDKNTIGQLAKNLSNVYDFNAFIKRVGKGESWIRYFTYLQDIIGIKSYYELYNMRYQKRLDDENKNENLNLTRLNTILSGLIFASIFLTIAIFLFEGEQNHFDFFIYNIFNNEILKTMYISFAYTVAIAAFFVIFLAILIKLLFIKKRHK